MAGRFCLELVVRTVNLKAAARQHPVPLQVTLALGPVPWLALALGPGPGPRLAMASVLVPAQMQVLAQAKPQTSLPDQGQRRRTRRQSRYLWRCCSK